MLRKCMVLAALVALFASSAFATSRFVASFVDDDGLAKQVNLTISDGNAVQKFLNVSSVDAVVSSSSTYTYEYASGEHTVVNRVNIPLAGGETHRFTFHALGNMVERERPYIAVEEEGASASLSYCYDPFTHRLTWDLNQVSGKFVDVMIKIDSNLNEGSNYALTQCAANGQSWFVDLPISAGWNRGGSAAVAQAVTGFGPIGQGLVAAGFRDSVRNDSTLRDPHDIVFESVVTDLSGNVIGPSFLYPQYALSPGNYLVKPTDASAGNVQLTLPWSIKAGRHEILEYYAVDPSVASPFSFNLLAENYFTKTAITSVVHNPDGSVKASMTSQGSLDRWGYFLVPESYTIGTLFAELQGGGQQQLQNLVDYTVAAYGGYKYITVRTSSDMQSVTLQTVPEPSSLLVLGNMLWASLVVLRLKRR